MQRYAVVMPIKACSKHHKCSFLGGRYGSQLMHKVLEMAEGIDVGKMPSYELVPNLEAKKRLNSSDGSKSVDTWNQSYLSIMDLYLSIYHSIEKLFCGCFASNI